MAVPPACPRRDTYLKGMKEIMGKNQRIKDFQARVFRNVGRVTYLESQLRVAAAENTELKADIAQDQVYLGDERDKVRELKAQLALHDWISVEDRLPEDQQEEVLWFKVGFPILWEDSEFYFESSAGYTHWKSMSLPAQGKEQAVAEKCEWKRNEPGNFYETSCGKTWPRYVTDDYLCPYCGLKIKECE